MSRQIPSVKADATESKYPYIIELALTDRALDVGLSCRIMNFHRTRHMQPRHGHTAILKEGRIFRWCFSDLDTAQAFIEQFGGSLRHSELITDRAR
jgi:hypothetical protein